VPNVRPDTSHLNAKLPLATNVQSEICAKTLLARFHKFFDHGWTVVFRVFGKYNMNVWWKWSWKYKKEEISSNVGMFLKKIPLKSTFFCFNVPTALLEIVTPLKLRNGVAIVVRFMWQPQNYFFNHHVPYFLSSAWPAFVCTLQDVQWSCEKSSPRRISGPTVASTTSRSPSTSAKWSVTCASNRRSVIRLHDTCWLTRPEPRVLKSVVLSHSDEFGSWRKGALAFETLLDSQ